VSGLRASALLGRRGTTLILAVIGIGLLLLVSLPITGPKRRESDPAADARAVYRTLLDRVSADSIAAGGMAAAQPAAEAGAPAVDAAAIDGSAASPAVATAAAGPGEQAAMSSTGARDSAGGLTRDLFAPAARAVAHSPSPAMQAAAALRPPALPRLTGILIDGSSRRAVLSGRVVAAGDEVNGYRIVAIEPGLVRLARGGDRFKLELKEKP